MITGIAQQRRLYSRHWPLPVTPSAHNGIIGPWKGILRSLAKRRIIFTVSAIAGFLPVTLVFIWGALFFLAGTLGASPINWENLALLLVPISISVFCLWACWKLYAISMATTPEVRHRRLLITGVLGTISWGLPWAYFGRDFPMTVYIFLIPGLTAAVMLAMALKRQTATVTQ